MYIHNIHSIHVSMIIHYGYFISLRPEEVDLEEDEDDESDEVKQTKS